VEVDGREMDVHSAYRSLRDHFRSIHCGASHLAPFSGGMVGYMGYGMVEEFESICQPRNDDPFPDMYFVVPEHLVCIDHIHARAYLISHGDLDQLVQAFDSITSVQTSGLKIDRETLTTSQVEFESMVLSAKERILEGEVFQVVPSRRIEFRIHGDALEIYKILRTINPSPYLFFLDYGDIKLIGSSPELLVRLEGDKLTTRPLAGTRPRDADPEEDEKLKLDMLLDEKERAEHLMLVDLHRNDMGSVSTTGTVKVTELMNVEKFSHVQHIVSNIESRLDPRFDAFDALKACFPAGTVTGAPKIRAMEIIAELENHSRGPYGGAVGYFDFNGNMDFGIVIRSIMVAGEYGYLQAGAGIVHDSVPEKEFQETQHKMGALLLAMINKKSEG
jgi:anthranilate synthase component I